MTAAGRPRALPGPRRCGWEGGDPLYRAYHDTEWGVPLHDDRRLFEMLCLEGAQAGLSWITILRKREHYRKAFDNFRPEKITRYDKRKVERLLRDPGIVRNRLKVEGVVKNARAFLDVVGETGSFDAFIWQFTGGSQIVNRRRTLKQIPASTPESEAMSRELRRRGFTFVGPTICYAFMQAAGMVNDHLTGCFRYGQVSGGRGRGGKRAPGPGTRREAGK